MLLEIKKVRTFVWDESNITINKSMLLEIKKVRTFVWTEVKYGYVCIWYDIGCLIKSRNCILVVDYSNKATLLLGWSHCYIILRSSSQSCWPLRNIHFSNDNGSFTFNVDVFFTLSLPRLRPDKTKVWARFHMVWHMVWHRVSYKNKKLLTFREQLNSNPIFGWIRVAHVVMLLCLSYEVPVLWCPLWFPNRNEVWFDFTSSCL